MKIQRIVVIASEIIKCVVDFLSDLLIQSRPKFQVAAKYALVELTPPKLSDIPAIKSGKPNERLFYFRAQKRENMIFGSNYASFCHLFKFGAHFFSLLIMPGQSLLKNVLNIYRNR